MIVDYCRGGFLLTPLTGSSTQQHFICESDTPLSLLQLNLIIHMFQLGLRNPRHPAFWWLDDKGHEIKWSFEQLTKYSKR